MLYSIPPYRLFMGLTFRVCVHSNLWSTRLMLWDLRVVGNSDTCLLLSTRFVYATKFIILLLLRCILLTLFMDKLNALGRTLFFPSGQSKYSALSLATGSYFQPTSGVYYLLVTLGQLPSTPSNFKIQPMAMIMSGLFLGSPTELPDSKTNIML